MCCVATGARIRSNLSRRQDVPGGCAVRRCREHHAVHTSVRGEQWATGVPGAYDGADRIDLSCHAAVLVDVRAGGVLGAAGRRGGVGGWGGGCLWRGRGPGGRWGGRGVRGGPPAGGFSPFRGGGEKKK